ncbi:NACHT domain-containing protein [Microbacterium sp. SA39]|uniref:NACHT domain-containing protein n=1 Tax=Microbacterium sp. SA39 TaxID=1263625 RepID=UPI0005F9B196|nr:ATP-binding protein [Microbacterium sp. SA39]KJQ52515.1 NACHT domain protein [Microbacterium sp. SA39]
MAASRGSIGGASDDAGTEYKRGVAAFAIAYGLAGTTLPLDCFADDPRQVSAVDAETDDPVDDVRVTFASGRVAYIQAKHTLKTGRPINEAVSQWVSAARQGGLDRERHRLVIASQNVSGPMKDLGDALERRRSGRYAKFTDAEQRAASALDALLDGLTERQKADVWACGAVWHLQVREAGSSNAQNALQQLRLVVSGDNNVNAHHAWTHLLGFAGRVSGLRSGHTIRDWAGLLTGASIPLRTDGATPAASAARRVAALATYRDQVTHRGTHIQLEAMGPALPDLPLADSDVGLRIAAGPDGERNPSELRWAFMLRHRAVLTGLPGSGKSTALKQLAAQFVEGADMPLPIYASLRNYHPAVNGTGLLEHILDEATSIVDSVSRTEVAAEVRQRIAEDSPLALILDSLDETYDRRFEVVKALAALTRQLPGGTAILLATRDIGHADARSLGWYDMRLLPPKSLDKPVRSILTLTAANQGIPEDERGRWIAERAEWVEGILADDSVLAETPLFGSLLALLAGVGTANSLPTSRGAILSAVVRMFILKRELKKTADLLDLRPDEALLLGEQAFATEAHTLLNSRATATEAEVVAAIAKRLEPAWGLPPAKSVVMAQRIVRVFDEAGVFVIDTSGSITPRISLLAEVGDAMMAIDCLDGDAWVSQRISAEQYEPLILALTLSPDIVRIAMRSLEATHSRPLAQSIATSVAHGANLDAEATRLVAGCLISHLSEATMDGWSSWRALRALDLEPDQVDDLLYTLTALPAGYQHIVRSEAHLLWESSLADDAALDLMRMTLATETLPLMGDELPSGPASNAGLVDAQVRAAEHMLVIDPATADEIAARLNGDAPFFLHQRLLEILVERGNAYALDKTNEMRDAFIDAVTEPGWDPEVNRWPNLLDILSEASPVPLTSKQTLATPELARLFTLLNLNVAGSITFVNSDPSEVGAAFTATANLFGIDRGVLSAEADIVKARVDRWGMDPLFAVMESMDPHGYPEWESVDAVATAAELNKLLRFPRAQAGFAAWALQQGPADIVLGLLDVAVSEFESSPRHQYLVARAFARASPNWEPAPWAEHANPVLRQAVAATLPEDDPLLRTMAHHDADRHVQAAAVARIVSAPASDAAAVLDGVLRQKPVGWMCRSCRKMNPPSRSVCSGDRCYFAPPDPQEEAQTGLALLR